MLPMIGDIPRIDVLTEPFRRIVRDVRAVADDRRNAPRRRKAVPDTRRDLQQRVVVRPAEQHFHDPPARRGLGAVVIQDNLQLPHRHGKTLRLARMAFPCLHASRLHFGKVHFPDLPEQRGGRAHHMHDRAGRPWG